MLVLSRNVGEAILIGDNISIVVLGVSGRQVRLGITAPKGVAVDREEIAIRKAGGSPKPAVPAADEFCIDDHVRMVADARRYRWLRDGALGTGSANVPMVRIGMGEPVGGADLDLVVDAVALNWPMLDEFDEEVVA